MSWRVTAFALLWLVVAGGHPMSWIAGVPLSLFAAWLSLHLAGPRRVALQPAGVIRFVPCFLWESVRAGSDVAFRAFQRNPALAPGFVEYRTWLPAESQRVFLANALSLVPGTVGVHLKGNRLLVHVLDRRMPVRDAISRTEAQVALVLVASGGDPALGERVADE